MAFLFIKYILCACLCGVEEQSVIQKTDLLPDFGESPNYSGWDPDLIGVGASTLILASLKVYSFSVSEIDFYVIIFSGVRFLSVILALRVTDACGIFQNLTVC